MKSIEERGIELEEAILREGVDNITNELLNELENNVFKNGNQNNYEELLIELMRCKKISGLTPSATLLSKNIEVLIEITKDKREIHLKELMASLREKSELLRKDNEEKNRTATTNALKEINATMMGVGSSEKIGLINEISKGLKKNWYIGILPFDTSKFFKPPKNLIIFYNETKDRKEIGSLYELCNDHIIEASHVFIWAHSFSKDGVIAEKRLLHIASATQERKIPFSVIAYSSKYCLSPPHILENIARESPLSRFLDFIPANLINNIALEDSIYPFQEIKSLF